MAPSSWLRALRPALVCGAGPRPVVGNGGAHGPVQVPGALLAPLLCYKLRESLCYHWQPVIIAKVTVSV